MEIITKVRLETDEKMWLEEGIKILARYCGLVSCRDCVLKNFCNFGPEGTEYAFPDKLLNCVEPLLE
jgi:hypothetical protein